VKHKKQTLDDILKKWHSRKVSTEFKESVSDLIGKPTYKCIKSIYGCFYDFGDVNKAIKRVAKNLPSTKERHYTTLEFLESILDNTGYFWFYKK
jgi:hypothetical protein